MNTYLFYRRIRGPVFLLTFGVTALLAQWDILGFSQSWPLYLIVAGVLRLAEGAAFAASGAAYITGAPLYSGTTPNGGASGSVAGWQSGPAAPPPVPGTGLATTAPAPLATTEAGFRPVREEER